MDYQRLLTEPNTSESDYPQMNPQPWTNQQPLDLADRYVAQFPPGYILDKWYLLKVLYPDDFQTAIQRGLVNNIGDNSAADQTLSSYSHYSSIQNRSVSSTLDASPVHSTNYPSAYISTHNDQAINLTSAVHTATNSPCLYEASRYTSQPTTIYNIQNAEAFAYPVTNWHQYQAADSTAYMYKEYSGHSWTTPYENMWPSMTPHVATHVPLDSSAQEEQQQECEGSQPPTLYELQPLSTLSAMEWVHHQYEGDTTTTSTVTSLEQSAVTVNMPCISAEDVDEAIGGSDRSNPD